MTIQRPEKHEDFESWSWRGDLGVEISESLNDSNASLHMDESDAIDIEEFAKDVEKQSAGLAKLSNVVGESQLASLHENKDMLLSIFKFLDTDGSGTIDIDEFEVGMKLLNKRLPLAAQFEDHKELFSALDADGNGEIDIEEFHQLFSENEKVENHHHHHQVENIGAVNTAVDDTKLVTLSPVKSITATLEDLTLLKTFSSCPPQNSRDAIITELEKNHTLSQQRDCQRMRQTITRLGAQLFEKEKQTTLGLANMHQSFEEEKDRVKEEMRWRILGTQKETLENEEFLKENRVLPDKKISELETEGKELEATKEELETLISSLRQDNANLEQANEEVGKLFQSLNEFSKKKTKDNEKLKAAQETIVNVFKGALGLKIEPRLKSIYRGYLYKCAQGVLASDRYDQNLYEEVTEIIREIEAELGCEVLSFDHPETEKHEDFESWSWRGDLGVEISESLNDSNASLHMDESDAIDIEEFAKDVEKQSAGLAKLSNVVGESQLASLHENKDMLLSIFKFLDTDGSGTIDIDEFEVGMKLLNKRLPLAAQFEDHKELFSALDADGNGEIDIEEFHQLFSENEKVENHHQHHQHQDEKDRAKTIDDDPRISEVEEQHQEQEERKASGNASDNLKVAQQQNTTGAGKANVHQKERDKSEKSEQRYKTKTNEGDHAGVDNASATAEKASRESLLETLENDLKLAQQQGIQGKKKEIAVLEEKVREIERRREEELQHMRQAFGEEKESIKEEMQWRILGAQREEIEAQELLLNGGFDKIRLALEREGKKLEVDEKEVKTMMDFAKKENDKLLREKEVLRRRLQDLNEKSKEKAKEHEQLVAVERSIFKVYDGALKLQTEPNLRHVYRRYLYKCARGVVSSNYYDQNLVDEVTGTIRAIERRLGCDALSFEDPQTEEEDNWEEDNWTEDVWDAAITGAFPAPSGVHNSTTNSSTSFSINDSRVYVEAFAKDAEKQSALLANLSNVVGESQVSTLYANKDKLLSIFNYLDTDGNGTIDIEEFEVGLNLLNKRLPVAARFKDHVELFIALDADGNGELDISEFKELFSKNQ